jgi:hypothetical protein
MSTNKNILKKTDFSGAITGDGSGITGVTAAQIPNIDAAKITTGTFATARIANLAITTEKLAELSVSNTKLIDSSVSTDKIADLAVTSGKLANSSVTADKILSNAVTTVKINDLAVTVGKINDSAVTTAKINNAAVTEEKIANGSVTNAKMGAMAANSIKGRRISIGTPVDLSKGDVLTLLNVQEGANNYTHPNHTGIVTSTGDGATSIADGALLARYIADGAITSLKLANTSVTWDKLDNQAVKEAKIFPGAVTTTKIANGNVTPEKLSETYIVDPTDDYTNEGDILSYIGGEIVWNAPDYSTIVASDIENWDTAYGWGDHSGIGYIIEPEKPLEPYQRYPLLRKHQYSLDDYPEDYIPITTKEQLALIGLDENYPLDGNYMLMNNIDLECNFENQWTPIGDITVDPPLLFSGIFDGNGFAIYNLYINQEPDPLGDPEEYIGFFKIVLGGTVRNLEISGEIYYPTNYYSSLALGLLAGAYAFGTVENCSSFGIVEGFQAVGNMIGYLGDGITVSNCYSYGSIFAASVGGGLFGIISENFTEGEINYFTNCYSYCIVDGGLFLGGLVAISDLLPEQIVASDCFWDTEISTQATSFIGTGKTTEELYNQETYTNWDFENDWTMLYQGQDNFYNILVKFLDSSIGWEPIFIPSIEDTVLWNEAYNWGNHALENYIINPEDDYTSEGDFLVWTSEGIEWQAVPTLTITQPDIDNWDAAYGWGDHASAGYIVDPADETTVEGHILVWTEAGIVWQENSGFIIDPEDETTENGYILAWYDDGIIWKSIPVLSVTPADIINWDAAYTWVTAIPDNDIDGEKIKGTVNLSEIPYHQWTKEIDFTDEIALLDEHQVIDKFNAYDETWIPITTIDELQLIGNDGGYPVDGNYFLANDIDASDTSTWNAGAGFEPITINGILDGRCHTISGLVINRPTTNGIGLIESSSTNSIVRNIYLENCDIDGQNNVGALIAWASGFVYNCSAIGTLTGRLNVGGLIGVTDENDTDIKNCYAALDITVKIHATANNIGGLIGINYDDNVINCYSASSIDLNGQTLTDIGGLIGRVEYPLIATITSSYYDATVSGMADTTKGTPKTTAQLSEESTFVNWDFNLVWEMSNDEYFTYPILKLLEYTLDWIPISDIETLQYIGTEDYYEEFPLSGNYYLTQNIDASQTKQWNPAPENGFGVEYLGWNPIGRLDVDESGDVIEGTSDLFSGVFDGNGFFIKNLYSVVFPEDEMGTPTFNDMSCLIKGITNTVKNLKLVNFEFNGALCAPLGWCFSESLIKNCQFKGSIIGSVFAAGITINSNNLENCSVEGSVTPLIENYLTICGISYFAAGLIKNSFCKLTIDSSLNLSGVFGVSYSTTENCDIENCYSYIEDFDSIQATNKRTFLVIKNASTTISNCFILESDSLAVGLLEPEEVDGLQEISEQEFLDNTTFAAWDFDDIWTNKLKVEGYTQKEVFASINQLLEKLNFANVIIDESLFDNDTVEYVEWLNYGNPEVDGSIRQGLLDGSFVTQKKVDGEWVTKATLV